MTKLSDQSGNHSPGCLQHCRSDTGFYNLVAVPVSEEIPPKVLTKLPRIGTDTSSGAYLHCTQSLYSGKEQNLPCKGVDPELQGFNAFSGLGAAKRSFFTPYSAPLSNSPLLPYLSTISPVSPWFYIGLDFLEDILNLNNREKETAEDPLGLHDCVTGAIYLKYSLVSTACVIILCSTWLHKYSS